MLCSTELFGFLWVLVNILLMTPLMGIWVGSFRVLSNGVVFLDTGLESVSLMLGLLTLLQLSPFHCNVEIQSIINQDIDILIQHLTVSHPVKIFHLLVVQRDF
jgi:hypothetical protein